MWSWVYSYALWRLLIVRRLQSRAKNGDKSSAAHFIMSIVTVTAWSLSISTRSSVKQLRGVDCWQNFWLLIFILYSVGDGRMDDFSKNDKCFRFSSVVSCVPIYIGCRLVLSAFFLLTSDRQELSENGCPHCQAFVVHFPSSRIVQVVLVTSTFL